MKQIFYKKRKTMFALLMSVMIVSLAYADESKQSANESVEPVTVDTDATVKPEPVDYNVISAVTVQKLHADAELDAVQQAQIADLTVAYFQERQAVLDVPDRYPFSEKVIMLLKEIEDRYQEEVNRLLSPEQRESVNTKRKERKNVMLQESQVAAREAAVFITEQEQSNEERSN